MFSLIVEILIIFILFIFMSKLMSGASRNLLLMFMAWTMVRLGLLYYQIRNGNLPMSGLDWGVFHNNAVNIMNNANSFFDLLNPPSTMINRGDYYERVVAVVYSLLGVKTTYMHIFSYIMSEITFILIYRIAYKITFDLRIASMAAMIFYIWPMEVIYSVAYLREMTVQCLFAVSLLFFISFLKENRIFSLIMAFFFAYLCAGMHSGMIAVFAGYVSIFFFFSPRTKEIKITPIRIALVVVVIVVVYGSGILGTVTTRFNGINSISDLNAKLDSVEGTTDYIGAAGSTWGAIFQTPMRLFYFLVAPLPWHVRSSGTLIAFVLDGILRLVLVYRVYKSYKQIRNMQLEYVYESEYELLFKAFIIIWLMTDLVFSWGTNNFGTAMRHRLKIFPLELMIMYVIGKASSLANEYNDMQ